MALTPKQALFVEHYVVMKNATKAAIAAGYSKKTAQEIGSHTLSKVHVREAIDERLREQIIDIRLNAPDVRKIWESALVTDRNEIAEVRRVPCRFCWGKDHRYQETLNERRDREQEHAQLLTKTPEKDWHKVPPFDEKGGIGYTRKKHPNDDCPECFGDGEEHLIIHDTRKLSPAARMLYDGVDVKNGALVIKTVSRAAAEEKLAKHLGMFNEVGSTGDALPIEAVSIPTEPIEASRAYLRLIRGK